MYLNFYRKSEHPVPDRSPGVRADCLHENPVADLFGYSSLYIMDDAAYTGLRYCQRSNPVISCTKGHHLPMKPVIGITPALSTDEMAHGTFYRYALSRTYTDAIHAAGGIPVILPASEWDSGQVLDRIDALLLSGGGDIDPARFNETTVHPKTYGISDERDAFEIAAFRAAVERDLPTLCICRGIQVMSVAQHGTLHQHLPDDVPDEIGHRQHEQGKKRDDVGHGVRLTNGHHLLRSILGVNELEVNSFHHQAVATPGDHLDVLARSSDGVIEALGHSGMRFGLGVQWHPEMLAHNRPDHAALFYALVGASERP